jgi:hypothetical protein
MAFETVTFIQQLRTPHSEIWIADLARGKEEQLAQIDIHYPPGRVEATVILLRPIKEEFLTEFLNLIDDELISAADVESGNLKFRVIHGGQNKAELFHREQATRSNLLLESL